MEVQKQKPSKQKGLRCRDAQIEALQKACKSLRGARAEAARFALRELYAFYARVNKRRGRR